MAHTHTHVVRFVQLRFTSEERFSTRTFYRSPISISFAECACSMCNRVRVSDWLQMAWAKVSENYNNATSSHSLDADKSKPKLNRMYCMSLNTHMAGLFVREGTVSKRRPTSPSTMCTWASDASTTSVIRMQLHDSSKLDIAPSSNIGHEYAQSNQLAQTVSIPIHSN